MYTNDRRIEYNMCTQIMKKMYGYPNIMKKVGKKTKGKCYTMLKYHGTPLTIVSYLNENSWRIHG